MTAALFAAVLSHKLAPFSIKVYISAISLLHCREGLQSPTTHSTWDSKTTQPTHGKQDYTLQAMLNHLQHCLKWRRHDCDMLSTAISLIWFLVWEQYTISSHHSFNPCLSQLDHTHNISLPVKQSHLLSYDPKQIKLLMDTQSHCMPQEEAMPSLNYHFSRMLTPYESLFSQKQGTPLTLQLLVPEDTTQVARSHDTSQYPQLMNGCSYFSSRGWWLHKTHNQKAMTLEKPGPPTVHLH